jgi:NACalpha-BTF3-like transcription factor
MLDNPMHIIFKRIPTGQTVMMMMPWLPIELIKENNAILFTSDILTVIEPKDDLVEYYGNVVVEAQHRMEEQRKFTSLEEQYDEGEEEEYDEEEIDEDDLYDIMQQRKRSNIH